MSRSPRQLGLSFARLMRPQNTRFSVLFFVLPQLAAYINVPRMIGGGMLTIVLYGISTSYNDMQDYLIDQANHRDLPLVRTTLSSRHVKLFIIALLVVLLLLNVVLPQPYTVYFTATYLLLALVYSAPHIHLSHRGLAGTLVLGICYVGLPLYLGISYSSTRFTADVWLLLAASVLLSAPVLLYKDFKDIKGDRAHGKRTPVVRYGEKLTKILTYVFFVSGIGTMFLVNKHTAVTVLIATLAAAVLLAASYFEAQRQRWLLLYMLFLAALYVIYFTV